MAEFSAKLPIDADVHSISKAAGGDPFQNRYDHYEGLWHLDAKSQRALDTAVKAYDHEAVLLARARSARLAELADLRWRAETAGIEVLGLHISTSRESQAMVHCAQIAAASLKGKEAINFKALDGWKKVTAVEMDQIWKAVAAHVQSCFTRECELAAAVSASRTMAELEAIKVEF